MKVFRRRLFFVHNKLIVTKSTFEMVFVVCSVSLEYNRNKMETTIEWDGMAIQKEQLQPTSLVFLSIKD